MDVVKNSVEEASAHYPLGGVVSQEYIVREPVSWFVLSTLDGNDKEN